MASPLSLRHLLPILLAGALAPVPSLHAQAQATPDAAPAAPATITVRIYDARTGRQIVPNNFLIRFDHQEDIHNEHLHIDDDGTGQITVPAGAAFLNIEATFDKGMSIYINCDTGKEKDARRRHWYPIATILSTGVIAPNECFNGKYERPRIDTKPGEYSFYVRQYKWNDVQSYE